VKSVPLPTLVDKIRTVAAGGSVLTPEQLHTRLVKLTPRERPILRLAMDGLGNREIAAKIGGSPKTVETHLGSIFERYGIKGGRGELPIRAAEEGWVDLEQPRHARGR